MSIFLAIPTMDPRLLDKCLFSAWSRATTSPHTFIWYNGMDRYSANLTTNQMGEMRNHLDREILLTTDFSKDNIGVTAALHRLYEMVGKSSTRTGQDDFILFIHDDTLMMEDGWDQKCLDWLGERPNCAIFGMGGARALGDPDLYKKPYQLQQLARRGFISNMMQAEAHGARVTTPTQVATLDGFSLGVRYSFLQAIGGWTFWPSDLPHHSYDNSLCCMAAEHGFEVWMLPIYCHHQGGQTATKVNYVKDFGMTEQEIHSKGHEFLYNRWRGVLPIQV